MPGSRRLSQRISEGDGIAIIVRVSDVDAARAAEGRGAKAVAVDHPIAGIRAATSLPVLWTGTGPAVDADAQAIMPEDDGPDPELETVVDVRDEGDLQSALARVDPEMFLLSAGAAAEGDDSLETILELLPGVPAGKLAIANVEAATRADVLSLERAGVDAILVSAEHVAELTSSDS